MFERALALVVVTADRALESRLRLNIGRRMTRAGDLLQALVRVCLALDMAHGTGNTGDMAHGTGNTSDLALAMLALGLLHQADGQLSVAAPLLADALVLARQRRDPSLLAQLLQALGEALAARALPLVAPAHERLSPVHEATGDLNVRVAALPRLPPCQPALAQCAGAAAHPCLGPPACGAR